MNGRHLRTDNGITFSHFLRKFDLFNGGGTNRAPLAFLFSDPQGGKQRADSDSCGSKIVHFINFQTSVNLIRAG